MPHRHPVHAYLITMLLCVRKVEMYFVPHLWFFYRIIGWMVL